MKVAIVGGGAAGFFAAFSVKEHHPESQVIILEKSDKLLSKVKISGGGRCNVTHACFQVSQLSKFYPRGAKQLKKAFSIFQPKDTVAWFRARGIDLKQNLMVGCFLFQMIRKRLSIVFCMKLR